MAIKAVFLISQAFQYVQALEARHARGYTPDECAVLFFNKPFSGQLEQLKAVLDERDWGVAQFIPYPKHWRSPGKKRTFRGRLKVAISKLGSASGFRKDVHKFLKNNCPSGVELVATGNFLSRPHRHFLAVAEQIFAAKELMILDEGTSVPNFVVPLRYNPNEKNKVKRFKGRFSRFDVAGKALSLLTGLTFHHPDKVTFFTVYGDMRPPAADTVEVNNFPLLKQQIQHCDQLDEIWFVGTCYVEHDFMNKADFQKVLKAALKDAHGQKIKYFPHRYETSENLKEIEDLGFTVMKTGMALEPWIAQQNKRPQYIAAIASSAIDNISVMFGGQVPIHLYRPSGNFYKDVYMEQNVNDIIDGHVQNARGEATVHDVSL